MPAGAVLTGGRSLRMGTDKALVEVDGTAMAVRVAGAMAAAGLHPVWCQGGDAPALEALGLTVVPDPQPGEGPLVAIAAALGAAAPDDVVVCACDLADVTPGTIEVLVATIDRHPRADVVVAVDLTGPHLLSVWRQAAAPRLEALVVGGLRGYLRGLAALETIELDVPSADVRNVNGPDDLIGPGDLTGPE
jgi:molybdopterin-guanine dinucleotide biosynthesis protein A